MKFEGISLYFGNQEIPLNSLNIPLPFHDEITNLVFRADQLLDSIPIPGFLKGKELELRIRMKLE